MPYDAELSAAIAAARTAAGRIMEIYATFVAIPDAQASITTQADHDAQELILQALSARFPQDGFVAEERTPTLATLSHSGSRTWVIDPIDGTRGFAQKTTQFSVMIALVDGDSVAVGVVLEPALDRLTYATRGGGCWRIDGGNVEGNREGKNHPLPCRVTTNADVDALVLTQSVSKAGVVTKQVQALKPATVRETHSAGVKLALVARGEVDLYVNHYPNFHDWDICAGHLLVDEAGGRVSTLRGLEVRYGSSSAQQRLGLIASNGLVHDAVLAKLQGVF